MKIQESFLPSFPFFPSFFSLLSSSSPMGQTAVSGNSTLHHWSCESLSFSLSWSSVNPWLTMKGGIPRNGCLTQWRRRWKKGKEGRKDSCIFIQSSLQVHKHPFAIGLPKSTKAGSSLHRLFNLLQSMLAIACRNIRLFIHSASVVFSLTIA